MSKTVVRLIALLTLMFVGRAFCLSGSKLSGNWTVIWAGDSKNQNEMSLTYGDGGFSGAYISDSKDSCPVSGNFDGETSGVTLKIKCPKWEIRMEGTATSNGNTIKGDYWAYGNAGGPFTMTKHEK